MKTCSICGQQKDLVDFPQTGTFCRKCKAKKLRDRKFIDPDYYKKKKAYRDSNKERINEQKRQDYIKDPQRAMNRNKRYYQKNNQYCRERQRKYQAAVETVNMESWLTKCIKHSRAADKKYVRDFDIDIGFMMKLFQQQQGRCAVTNVPMIHDRNNLFSASIDRIDSKIGHTRKNVQLVCQAVNLAKREYSNDDIFDFFKAASEELRNIQIKDFNGFSYPESTAHYPIPAKKMVIEKLRVLFKGSFPPPSYSSEELLKDLSRISDHTVSDYFDGVSWRSYKPDVLGFAGKRLIWHFQNHLWKVRTQGKPLIEEAWGNGPIFERALINLVDGQTRISFDRVIREFIFAGAGIPSQMHPGFAMAIYKHFGCTAGDVVYDPFAGWGGRMLASKALGLNYHACELSLPTHIGLTNIMSFIGSNFDIRNIDCLTQKMEAKFLLTSPPFGTEQYLGAPDAVNLDELILATDHIPLRVLHLNKSLLNMKSFNEIIEIHTHSQASSVASSECLVVLRR
jgi:hypothetical protein